MKKKDFQKRRREEKWLGKKKHPWYFNLHFLIKILKGKKLLIIGICAEHISLNKVLTVDYSMLSILNGEGGLTRLWCTWNPPKKCGRKLFITLIFKHLIKWYQSHVPTINYFLKNKHSPKVTNPYLTSKCWRKHTRKQFQRYRK